MSEQQTHEKTMKDLDVLNQLLRIMRGQEDPRTHVTVITNPDLKHLLSSSNITDKQGKAIINCYTAAELFSEFEPLRDTVANLTLRTSISEHQGWGTLQGIHLAEAYAPRLAGANPTVPDQPKKHWYSKKEKNGDEKK